MSAPAGPTSPIGTAGGLSSAGSLFVVLTLTGTVGIWGAFLGFALCATGSVIAINHVRKLRAQKAGTAAPARRPAGGHSPRCRAKSEATCRCPGRQRKTKR